MLMLPILAWTMVEMNAPAWCWWCWGITVGATVVQWGFKIGKAWVEA